MGDVATCPQCGALITRELERCRRCKTYLHGTALEGALITSLLPESLRARPGTATIALVTLTYYVMMVVLSAPAEPGAVLGFSGFTLIQLGATQGARILLGEHWRFLTSILAHHDLLHLLFNVSALASAGPIVEELFDRKKMFLIYVSTGVLSMVASFFWYVAVLDQPGYVSAGASGAISGLIGAALFGARRRVLDGKAVARSMVMWSIAMVAWGFMMPGINNAAHFGGWAVGALLGRFAPLGLASSVATNRALSVATLGTLLAALGCTVLMLSNLRGYPATLTVDDRPRAILGFRYAGTAARGDSDRKRIAEKCLAHVEPGARAAPPTAEALRECELFVRVAADAGVSYAVMASLLVRAGRAEEGARYLAVAHRMGGGM